MANKKSHNLLAGGVYEKVKQFYHILPTHTMMIRINTLKKHKVCLEYGYHMSIQNNNKQDFIKHKYYLVR